MEFNSDFIAGMEMNRYLYETGGTLETCAAVVTKNRRNALRNPLAPYGADLALNEILSGPPLSWPLGHREKAKHADGAIVMVLASERRALHLSEEPVWILGIGWCNGPPSLESREWASIPYVEKAAQMAFRQAGIRQTHMAVDFAEVDDTYAYKELQHIEAIGLLPWGEAGVLTADGLTEPDGDLPINASGGSLGMGNLQDANGLAKALEVVLQLRGEAGPRQLEHVQVGLAQGWRGVPTTSSAVAIFAAEGG
jgi:acetyl-CoA C-acetyltransferase